MTDSLRIWTMIHKADKCLLNAQQDRRIDKTRHEQNHLMSYMTLENKAWELKWKLALERVCDYADNIRKAKREEQ